MKRATVVIGTNFGDEGKGLMVDYHCSLAPTPPLIVRFNGGAQAGHTVMAPDGRRHVFHHFGAGAFMHAPTFLSRFFIVNPVLWRRESVELARIGVAPALVVDRRCPMTTPYDMLINQEIEHTRGSARHGSCGVGINETIERCATSYRTTVADAENLTGLRNQLEAIRGQYVRQRLHTLGINNITKPAVQFLDEPSHIDRFLGVVNAFQSRLLQTGGGAEYLRTWPSPIVFEGAQGLLLDEASPFFPHVTRSKTGLHNVVALAREAGISELDVTYVTRAYMTRHGAGPFPTEDSELSYSDDTNVSHDFQGSLRFGRLDIDQLASSIKADLQEAKDMSVTTALAVTHLDQVKNGPALMRAIADAVPVGRFLQSYGPQRTDVRATCENCQAPIPSGTRRCTDCGA